MSQFKKTRIVYVNHTGLVSGAERVLVSMLRGLDRARYEPYVLCPADGELPRLIEAEGAQYLPVPALHARFTWRPDRMLRDAVSLWEAIIAVRKTVRNLDPDFVHANTLRAGIVATLATIGTGRTVIWHVHDILPRHPASTAIRLLSYLSPRTRIIAVSHSAARAFCGTLAFNSRVQTIYNGTDLSRFPLKRPGGSFFRREAGIPDEAFLVCAVGQICERKGLRELVAAFARIYADAPRMHLAIVGRVVFSHEEQYRVSLLETVVASGMAARIHFTGERDDVSAVLQAADLLVLNSLEEPFGLVLIEAMSSGTPVLATRVGGIPEIVRDSENGWLVERGDTAGLASKLLGLSQNGDALGQVAQVAHDVTCPQFSLEQFQNKLHGFYAELTLQPDPLWTARNQTILRGYSGNQGDSHA